MSSDAQARVRELERLDALREGESQLFGRLTDLAAVMFDVPNVGIHLLDDERQWVKAFHGVIDTACSADDAICHTTVRSRAPLIVPDTREDERFASNPFVWDDESPVRFYAGAPLTTSRGIDIGTFCLLDATPRAFSSAQIERLEEFAALTTDVMELRYDERATRVQLDRALEQDNVTGWLSQHGLTRAVYRSATDRGRPSPAAVVDAGIDQFSELRTAFGAAARDRLLRSVAQRLADVIEARGADPLLASDVLRAHFGDGHFVLVAIFDRGTDEQRLDAWSSELAEAIAGAFEAPFQDPAASVHLTAKVGLTVDPTGSRALYEMVDAAHRPSEFGGAVGVSTVVRDGGEASERSRSRFTLDRQLRRAIAQRSFHLVFQPVVDLRSDCRVVGAEALLRWTRPDVDPIGPAVFVPAAEELGLIGQLDRVALELAAETQERFRVWRPDLWLAVNVSPRHLAKRAWVDRLLDESVLPSLDPARTKLEITESGIEGAGDAFEKQLARLQERGYRLALDDFGTGHSSLARLIRLPFDVLKVDRAFVADSPDGPGASIVSSLSELGAKLNLRIVGEGVETEVQESYLQAYGYDMAQGFRYARPLSEEAFVAYVEGS